MADRLAAIAHPASTGLGRAQPLGQMFGRTAARGSGSGMALSSRSVLIAARDEVWVTPSGSVASTRPRLLFALSGWAMLAAGTDVLGLRPGTLALIPSGCPIDLTPVGHLRTVTIGVDGHLLAAQLRGLPPDHPLAVNNAAGSTPGGIRLVHMDAKSIRMLAPELTLLAARDHAGAHHGELLARAVNITQHLGTLADLPAGTDATGVAGFAPRPEIARAASLLQHALEHPWTVHELAAATLLSESQLTRLFRHELGLSPSAYLWQARIERMAELLVTTTASITEAAHATGWTQQSAASRAFHRHYGLSPREFVRRIQAPRPLATAREPLVPD